MSKNKKVLLSIFVVVIISAAFFAQQKKPELIEGKLNSTCGSYDEKQIQLKNETLNVFISDNDCKRELGLGAVDSLNSNEGMFFVFPNSGNYGFWMKDMKFSIDIIWIDENFSIIGIEKNVAASTYPEIFGDKLVSKYVLEVSSGYSNANSIEVGDKISGF